MDDGSKATATVEYYKDVEGMAPDAGTRIFQKEVSVKEGKNTYSAGLANQVMDNGSRFSVIVRLSGASFYVYGGTAEGESYILGNAGWQDMYTANGSCAAIPPTRIWAALCSTTPLFPMAAATAISASSFPPADRKSTRLNSSHWNKSRMPSSA